MIGLFIGAFIAAQATGEFRVRVPDARTSIRAVIGGIGMGIGASLAGGCTVGNGMVQTSLFSFQGWVAMAFIALGVYAGAKGWLTPTELAVLADDTYSTDESIRSAEDEVLHDELPAADDAKSTPAAFPSATGVITLPTQHNTRSVRPLGDGRYALDTLGAVCPLSLIHISEPTRRS